MKKTLAILLAALMLVASFGTFAFAEEKAIEIAVIIKATDSDFWQQLLVGALNYDFENEEVHVTTYGPTSEADTAEQAEILDSVVVAHPDGIVLAPTLYDNCTAGIEAAVAAGIPVVICDNMPSTDVFVTEYATDSYAAGAELAKLFLEELEKRGVEPKGTIGLISAMAGSDTLLKRENGFRDYIAENAADITVLEPQYADNDIPTALTAAEDIFTANKDTLLGYYASNNCTGDGLAQFMTEHNMGDKLVAVVFDSDEAEINAIRDGYMLATAVQSPYNMGYLGCQTIYDLVKGNTKAEDYEKFIDTGATIVTTENVNDEAMVGVIDPFTLKKY
ncbi:MAG: ABC transporter substrate-binding protein [Clostridia bacterium]|nr:ABC transporter substrate-binding protein [Clostridia bacterium]